MSNTQQTYIAHGDIHTLATQVNETDKAQTTAAVIHGRRPDGTFVDWKMKDGGIGKVESEVVNSSGDAINPATAEGQQDIVTTLESVIIDNTSSSSDKSINVQAKETETWAWSFADTIASGVDTSQGELIRTGTGMTVSQSSGNMVITTGTNAYSETIIRSINTIDGRFRFEYAILLSQRIANQNFAIELTDIFGDNLAFTINSATSITVTKTAHGLTSVDVGKTISLCNIVGVSALPQLATIASIGSADTFNLTVSSFPASGSGTVSLYGFNFFQILYSGTSATALGGGFTSSRRGRANTLSSATTLTTASPGHIGIIDGTKPFDATFLDGITGSSGGLQTTPRASVNQNTPPDNVPLYIQIRVFNGSTAPASTTTATFGFLRFEIGNPLHVNIASIQPIGYKNAIPIIPSGGTQAVSLANGTVQPAVPTTPYFLNSAASTNGALIVTGTSGVFSIYATNIGASVAFVKLYNKATAPAVGTDVPELIIPVPAAVSGVPGVANIPAGFMGYRFALGLGIAITGGMADTDTTAVAAGQIKVKLTRTT